MCDDFTLHSCRTESKRKTLLQHTVFTKKAFGTNLPVLNDSLSLPSPHFVYFKNDVRSRLSHSVPIGFVTDQFGGLSSLLNLNQL